MGMITFVTIENGYIIDSQTVTGNGYSICYTVNMIDTDTNDIDILAEYITAYLLMNGLSAKEITASLCQSIQWQFSVTTTYQLEEIMTLDTAFLRAYCDYKIRGHQNKLCNPDTDVNEIYNKAVRIGREKLEKSKRQCLHL